MSVEARNISEVAFQPYQTVGPLTFGEVDGNAAFTVTGSAEVIVLPILVLLLPLIIWIVSACIWWWASSDLGYADISKVVGLISPLFGTVSEALIK